jgi:hypothetical protein
MPVSAECLADPKADFLSVYVRFQGGEGGRGLERIEVQRSENEVVHEWNLSPEPDGVQIRLPAEPPPDRCDWGGA